MSDSLSARGHVDAGTQTDEHGTEQPEPRKSLPKDVQFDILKNRRRRFTLQFVHNNEPPVKIGVLAEHLAAVENDKDVPMVTSQERKRTYVALYQCHLPRMNDVDVIAFEKNRGLVSLGPHAEDVLPYLTESARQNTAHAWLYAAFATIGFGSFLISGSTAPGGATVGSVVVGLTLAAVGGTAVWQLSSTRPSE